MQLIALHGFLGGPEAWRPTLRALGVRAHCVQLPLHGLPPRAPGCDSWERALDDLEAQLPTGPLALLGYSLGGRLSLGLCARLGARVQCAVIASANAGVPDEVREERERFERTWHAKLAQQHTMLPFVLEWEQIGLFSSQSEAQRLAQRGVRLAHDPQVVAGALSHLAVSQQPRYDLQLASWPVPLHFVVGEHDAKYRGFAEHYASARGERPHVIAGAGHNLLLEAPDALAATLRPLLPRSLWT